MAQQAFGAVELGTMIGLNERDTLYYCRRFELGRVIGNRVVLTQDDFYVLYDNYRKRMEEQDATGGIYEGSLEPLWEQVKAEHQREVCFSTPGDVGEILALAIGDITGELLRLREEVAILAGVLAAAAHGPEEITKAESRTLCDVSARMRGLV